MHRLSLLILPLILILVGCQPTSLKEVDEPEASSVIETVDPIVLPDVEVYERTSYENSALLLDNILSGGVPPDGIPSIDEPIFIPMTDAASLYQDNDQMFVTNLDGQVYLYPQSILVWHEIVNMEAYGVSVTYCPLTGSCITYELPDHIETSFGTSGNLINSNLLMYDRYTGTNISQIDGIGLDNDLEGYALETIPTYWIDFATAKESYPDALVLSEQTGYLRNYTLDPYGSYTEERASNYYASEGVMFPLIHTDEASDYKDKEVVIGIKHNGNYGALPKSSLAKGQLHNFTLGDTEMTAVFDPTINNIRIFFGSYSLDKKGLIVDADGNEWKTDGTHTSDFTNLESPNHFELMWFAWYAFYPDTEVIE